MKEFYYPEKSNHIVNRYLILETFYTQTFFYSTKFITVCLNCDKKRFMTFSEMLNEPKCGCE